MARFSPPLLDQLYLFNGHSAVNGLTHVVNGEQSASYCAQCLHFHPRLTKSLDLCPNLDGVMVVVQSKVHGDLGKVEGMTKRNDIGGFFSSHDPGELRDGQYISLFVTLLLDLREGRGLHRDSALRDADAMGGRFLADIDHVRFAFLVEMVEVCHELYAQQIKLTIDLTLSVGELTAIQRVTQIGP